MYPQFLGLTRRTLLSSNPFVPVEIIPNSLVQRPTRRSNQQLTHQRYGFPSDNNTELDASNHVQFTWTFTVCQKVDSYFLSFWSLIKIPMNCCLGTKSSSHLIIKDECPFFFHMHTRVDKFVKHKMLRRGFVVK